MYIEAPRMTIRSFTPEDALDLHEIFGDEETMENCEPAYDFEKTQSFLSSFCIARKGAVAAGSFWRLVCNYVLAAACFFKCR